jgi:hypothetical protein
MELKPLLRVAGPAWELARYFTFVAFLASAPQSGGADPLSAPWLAAATAGGLVMPAAFLMFALAPGRYTAYLPLLRLGKILQIATVVLLFVTGTIRLAYTVPFFADRVPVLGWSLGIFGVVGLIDLAVLAALFLVRTGTDTTGSP